MGERGGKCECALAFKYCGGAEFGNDDGRATGCVCVLRSVSAYSNQIQLLIASGGGTLDIRILDDGELLRRVN
ncbi:hypothetical protein BC832DRAFT_399877 [Gaertneriomyces semiglobifer]|nr:hypothetical protein BC832DRAFT_399877 [Gaertneriomyces semiglobifer]